MRRPIQYKINTKNTNNHILKIHVGTIGKRYTRLYPSRGISKYRNLPSDY